MCRPALKHNGRACGCTTAGVHAPLAVAQLGIKESRATETDYKTKNVEFQINIKPLFN